MAMYEAECDFCLEFGEVPSGLFPNLVGRYQSNRIVFQTGHIGIFPCLGKIVSGHLLIAPDYHVTSSTLLSVADRTLLAITMRRISDIYLHAHGTYPIFFEHGDPTNSSLPYGQCVSHAHIHVLPLWADMLPRLKSERLFLGCEPTETPTFNAIQNYVSFTDGKNMVTSYFSAENCPRQYMRKLYSELIGADASDWFSKIDPTVTLQSVARFRALLS